MKYDQNTTPMNEEQKNNVLANIDSISANDLYFNYIKPGHITLVEMMETGNLDKAKRLEISSLEESEKKAEEEKWKRVLSLNTTEGFQEYIAAYPNGKYIGSAQSIILNIQEQALKTNSAKQNYLNQIAENSNNYTPSMIKAKIHEGFISENDLKQIGIPDGVIKAIINYKHKDLETGDIPEEIPEGYTEVYFWGAPGSGKTCALSGVLSQAGKEGVLDAHRGPGFFYMAQLRNIFLNKVGILPPATQVEKTQYLAFNLKDESYREHPIALIELSGEVFQCFFHKVADLPMPGESHIKAFDNLKSYLSGPNRKVHFFVIDLSKSTSETDDLGLTQANYLEAAKEYFSKENMFNKTTDAIYIIATKSDLLDTDRTRRSEKAKAHLTKNYPAFVNVLKDVCRNLNINGRELRFIPFSLGDVFFNRICEFDNHSSNEIIEVLQKHTARNRRSNGFTDFFNN